MKFSRVLTAFFEILILIGIAFASEPQVGLGDLVISAESNFKLISEARKVALQSGQPTTIYLPQGVMIDALGMENGRAVYAVFTSLAHPEEGGYTAFYEEIQNQFDLSNARIHYGTKKVVNPELGFPSVRPVAPGDSLLLIPDWSNDRVMAFDYASGDLVDTAFVPSSSAYLSSPKEAQVSPWGTISVSDQIEDVVQEFDTSGAYLGILAPAGGPNPAIMDNIRGHAYRPNGNVVVAVFQGTNANAIVECDSAGNYLGNFISSGSGGLSSPFGIWFRTNDVLITGSSSQAVLQYDLNGNYLGNFASVSSFPEQVVEFPDGNIAVANLIGTTGVLIFSPTGQFIRLLSGVTSNRGAWQLGNGNVLTTNGTGVYELDPISGSLLRTVISGVNAQFIDLYALAPSYNILTTPDTLSFDTTYVNISSTEILNVANRGSDTLNVTNVISTNLDFSPDITSFDVNPGSSVDVTVTFTPTSPGLKTGWIVVESNDPDTPLDSIWVQGQALFGPEILLSLSAITDTLIFPDSMDVTIQIANIAPPGAAFLDWSASIQMIAKIPVDMIAQGSARNAKVLPEGSPIEFIILLEPTSGSIGPGDVQNLNARIYGLEPDTTYTADIEITSNDPVSPVVTIPVEIYVTFLDEISTADQIPLRFGISHNYPNPFNPSTSIEYQLPIAAKVNISIYNLLGQKIRSLINEFKQPGGYEVEWNGLNDAGQPVASGIYLYRIHAGDFVSSKKMIMLK